MGKYNADIITNQKVAEIMIHIIFRRTFAFTHTGDRVKQKMLKNIAMTT